MKSLVDYCADHSVLIGWVWFFISLIPVYVSHRALKKQGAAATRVGQVWRITEFFLLWCVPLLGFLATKSSEWASAKQGIEIANLQTNVMNVSAELAKATNDLAKANEQVEQLKGRTISRVQKVVLLEGVKKIAAVRKFGVVIWAQDPESRAYGNEILAVFKECGISGHFFVNGAFQQDLVLPPGICIPNFDRTNVPPISIEAGNLLLSVGIPVTLEYIGAYAKQFFGEDNLNLFIGAKPRNSTSSQ